MERITFIVGWFTGPLYALSRYFASWVTAPLRLAERVFDEAFPATAAMPRLVGGLDAELVDRTANRHRAAAYMARRMQRDGSRRRGAPLNVGTASAGMAYAA